MALAPEDVQTIVAAFDGLDWVQFVKQQMATGAGGHATPAPSAAPMPGAGMPPPHPGSVPPPGAPMGAPAAAPPAPPPAAPHPPAAAAAPPAPPAPPKPPAPPGGPAAGPPKPPAKPEDKEKNNYSADGSSGTNGTGEYQVAPGTKLEHDIGDQKAKYAACDDMFDGEDDFKKYAAYRKSRYEAGSGSMDGGHVDPKPATGIVEPSSLAPSGGDVSGDEEGDQSAAEYQNGKGESVAVKYSRLAQAQAKQSKEIETLKYALHEERGLRVDSQRLATLTDLRWGKGVVSIDPEAEIEKCRYSKMNDAQFAERVEFFLQHGNRVPIGQELYVGGADTIPQNLGRPVDPHGGERQRYSKDNSSRAFSICEAAALKGEELDYGTVLDEVAAGRR